jgi:hypothetical protein
MLPLSTSLKSFPASSAIINIAKAYCSSLKLDTLITCSRAFLSSVMPSLVRNGSFLIIYLTKRSPYWCMPGSALVTGLNKHMFTICILIVTSVLVSSFIIQPIKCFITVSVGGSIKFIPSKFSTQAA